MRVESQVRSSAVAKPCRTWWYDARRAALPVRLAVLMLALAFAALAAAQQGTAEKGIFEAREFATPADEARYRALTSELRCLVCQNQNIADSNADLARQLRDEVFKMISQGATDREIIDFMVARYGDFVLFNPPVKGLTLMLWFGPFAILALALLYLYRQIRRRAGTADEEPAPFEAEADDPPASTHERHTG